MDYNDKYLTEEGEYSLWLELQDCCPCLRLLGCYGIKKEYKDLLKYLKDLKELTETFSTGL